MAPAMCVCACVSPHTILPNNNDLSTPLTSVYHVEPTTNISVTMWGISLLTCFVASVDTPDHSSPLEPLQCVTPTTSRAPNYKHS